MQSLLINKWRNIMSQAEKNNKTEVANVKLHKTFGKYILRFFVLLLLLSLGAGAWYYRADLQNIINKFGNNEQEETLQAQVVDLKNQLDEYKNQLKTVAYLAKNPDLSKINERIDNIEQINLNTIKSKADVDALLGLLIRVDAAEEKLRNLAKVGDEGALILTAAMLVKEAGDRGGDFVYEMDVLSEILKGKPKTINEVKRLEEIAQVGVPSKVELQEEFFDAYVSKYPEPVDEEKLARNWKERIYHKLNKIVKVKNSNEQEKVWTEEDRAWGIVRDLVVNGEIKQAVKIAKKPLNNELLQNESFSNWLKQAELYIDFYDNISKITANGLAIMKVNFLKKNS